MINGLLLSQYSLLKTKLIIKNFQWIYLKFAACVNSLFLNLCITVKGIVHPKMKILSVITRSHVVPTL